MSHFNLFAISLTHFFSNIVTLSQYTLEYGNKRPLHEECPSDLLWLEDVGRSLWGTRNVSPEPSPHFKETTLPEGCMKKGGGAIRHTGVNAHLLRGESLIWTHPTQTYARGASPCTSPTARAKQVFPSPDTFRPLGGPPIYTNFTMLIAPQTFV